MFEVVMIPLEPMSHRELVENRLPGFGMAGELYGREDVLQNDLLVFFQNHWVMVGVVADVPEPGDVSVVDIGKASVLIVRNDDDEICAFRNVCRHRGARLKEVGRSTVGMLVCPYHQWTYDLDGRLQHASHMGKELDRSCRNLMPVHVRTVGPLIFICLADEPPKDIEQLDEVMAPRYAPFQLDKSRIAHETDIIENGNWKLVIENNRECYHCSATHPSLTVAMSMADFGYSLEELSESSRQEIDAYNKLCEKKYASWDADGLLSETVDEMGAERATIFRAQRLVIAGAGESQTMDTKVACTRLLGVVTRRDQGSTHLWTHNAWIHVMSDHAVVSYIIPLTPDKTLVRTKWLVHAEAVEGADYRLSELTEVWSATNAEDAKLVAITQSGTQDPAFDPGPYSSYCETYLEKFANWYASRLKAFGI